MMNCTTYAYWWEHLSWSQAALSMLVVIVAAWIIVTFFKS